MPELVPEPVPPVPPEVVPPEVPVVAGVPEVPEVVPFPFVVVMVVVVVVVLVVEPVLSVPETCPVGLTEIVACGDVWVIVLVVVTVSVQPRAVSAQPGWFDPCPGPVSPSSPPFTQLISTKVSSRIFLISQ